MLLKTLVYILIIMRITGDKLPDHDLLTMEINEFPQSMKDQ